MVDGRLDVAGEQGVTIPGAGGEFRVELAGQEPGVVGQFDHFHQITVGGATADAQALAFQVVQIAIVEFVTVAVAFVDGGLDGKVLFSLPAVECLLILETAGALLV